MLKSIDSYLEDFIDDRLNDIGQQVIRNDKRVEVVRQECFSLWDRILESLPKEDRSLIFRYEEKRNEEELLHFQIIYKQGLADGLRIGNISNKIRNKDIAGL
ncbi:hypothetical protein R9X47_14690 [Wukongibacter baidiensis]|uniref:hypothetical protein n=1 Tax=Wukongibacter baidiensis TaxID=1723361 RepID=UPI003D7F9705